MSFVEKKLERWLEGKNKDYQIIDSREYGKNEATALFMNEQPPRYITALARTDGTYLISGGRIREADEPYKAEYIFDHEIHEQPLHEDFVPTLEEVAEAVLT